MSFHILLRFFFPVIVLMILVACGGDKEREEEKFPDFKKTETGLYYKILKLGEGDSTPDAGDIITVALKYSTGSDSVFFESESTFALSQPSFRGSFEEGLLTMKEGDSVAFHVVADSLFRKLLGAAPPSFIDSGSYVRVDARLLLIHAYRNLEEDARAYAEWLDQADMKELKAMKAYLDSKGLLHQLRPTDGGLFFIDRQKGSGKRATYGRRIQVHYRGVFLDGREFDNTRKNGGEAMDFTLGTEGQVIRGMEMALATMAEGEKIALLLPSFLAFGQEGSATLIVPPVTPVVYEIELIKVY